MDPTFRKTLGLMFLTFCILVPRAACQEKDPRAIISSVSVESMGLEMPAKASVVVKTSPSLPVYVYWSDVTTWLPAEEGASTNHDKAATTAFRQGPRQLYDRKPCCSLVVVGGPQFPTKGYDKATTGCAMNLVGGLSGAFRQGHPNYTITEQAWKADNSIMLKSTIEIKAMHLSQLSYYYDYDKEHLVYYLPMSADIRSGDGSLIFHHTFDIPEKPATHNFTEDRFRIIKRPQPVVNYNEGETVTLQWRFVSRDENEFTMWRTLFESPTPDNDLDYADQMLYAGDATPEEVLTFEHINVTKSVLKVGKFRVASVTATVDPAGQEDEGLYVLFIKSRHLLSWEKALNLRLSTRLLKNNVTSLMHDDVALTLSYCDGNDVAVNEGTGYVGLNRSMENCVKCEAYGNRVRDLIYTKGRYMVRATSTNALVHSSYYPETKSIMYTFRRPAEEGQDGEEESSGTAGDYFCRAILTDNSVVSRKLHVAWTEPVVLQAEIVTVNQTEAQIECRAGGEPQPNLTFWRCDGDSMCNLKVIDEQPGFDLQLTSGDQVTGTLTLRMPAADLKQEAIMCRASNNFETLEEWLLFDNKVQIEEALLEEDALVEPPPEGVTGNDVTEDHVTGDDVTNDDVGKDGPHDDPPQNDAETGEVEIEASEKAGGIEKVANSLIPNTEQEQRRQSENQVDAAPTREDTDGSTDNSDLENVFIASGDGEI